MDRRRGLDALAIVRVGWTRYLWGKMRGGALVALVAVGLAIFVTETALAIAFPLALPHLLGWTVNPALPYAEKLSGVFGSMYPIPSPFHLRKFWSDPGLYILWVTLIALLATVSLATLATASAVWVRQPLLTLAVPMILFFLGDVTSQALLHSILVPSVYAGSYLYWLPSVGSWLGLSLYWVVPVAVSVLIVVWVLTLHKEWPRSVG